MKEDISKLLDVDRPNQVAYFVLLCYMTVGSSLLDVERPDQVAHNLSFFAILWLILERRHPTLGHLHSGNVIILTNTISTCSYMDFGSLTRESGELHYFDQLQF